LGETPTAATLDLLTSLAKDSSVTEEAYSAMVLVSARDIPCVSKDRRRQVLQTVAEESKNDGTKQRARKALTGIRYPHPDQAQDLTYVDIDTFLNTFLANT